MKTEDLVGLNLTLAKKITPMARIRGVVPGFTIGTPLPKVLYICLVGAPITAHIQSIATKEEDACVTETESRAGSDLIMVKDANAVNND